MNIYNYKKTYPALIILCLFVFNCDSPKPPNKNYAKDVESIIIDEIDKEVNLKDLVKILNILPKTPKNILRNLHYQEVKTNQDQLNCEQSKFQHQLLTKESKDNSIIHLTICESYINVEWEIDSILGDQISKITTQAIQSGFFLHTKTTRNERIIDSYSGPNNLILSVYRKENKNSKGNESIILTKAKS